MDKFQEADIWLAEQMGEHEPVLEMDMRIINPEHGHKDGMVEVCQILPDRKIAVRFLEKQWNSREYGLIGSQQFGGNILSFDDVEPWKVAPRSKDSGAMMNVADKMGVSFLIRMFNVKKSDKYTQVEIWKAENPNKKVATPIVSCELHKDHPSPQHAAAWAILEALRKVKK